MWLPIEVAPTETIITSNTNHSVGIVAIITYAQRIAAIVLISVSEDPELGQLMYGSPYITSVYGF